MTLFEPALVAYLQSHPALTSLIADRVYPGRLPDPPELPAVVYQRVSSMRVSAYDGPLWDAEARFQFDAWGQRHEDARLVADGLRLALLGYTGDMGGLRAQIPAMPFDSDVFEDETDHYRVITEFIIWHDDQEAS